MKKICLLTDQHICTNPRLWKEAKTLSNAGYHVVILTAFTTSSELKRDLILLQGANNIIYKPVLNLIKGEALELNRFYYRLRRRLIVGMKRMLNLDHPLLLGYAPELLMKAAKQEKADLYIAHMECSLYVGVQLMRNGFKVGFDMEDWYSRDYLIPERPVKLLESLEQKALKYGSYVSCPSPAMAEVLQQVYGVNQPPLVIYNSFSKKETPLGDSAKYRADRPSVIWFSQTIGPGRGLETFLKALEFVQIPVHVKFIGDVSATYREQLFTLFPFDKGHSFEICPQIPHHELTGELAKHQIGLAIENNYPQSRSLTITNKILQYTQAGLQVLATDTFGQIDLSNQLENIHLVSLDNIETWISKLQQLVSQSYENGNHLKQQFDQVFSWEVQEHKFIKKIKSIL